MAIKVLIIDDSPVMRSILSKIIDEADDLEVVGTAPHPLAAREMIKQLNPDVLTLDVEMPHMDGIEFLNRLMRLHPMPVVMISTLTQRGSDTTLHALELGAFDFIAKPSTDGANGLAKYSDDIHRKLREAYAARNKVGRRRTVAANDNHAAGPVLSPRVLEQRLICIGASTGGTEAIKTVLMSMPERVPGIVMTQHMPEMFTGSFAKRLDSLCKIAVKEAESGERILPGHAYLAPGHSHLKVVNRGGHYYCELEDSEPVNRHRPSVDVLFDSVARQVGAQAVGIILTGMGKDGAQGLLKMREAGCWTLGQNQETCVVYGMPREAAEIGACVDVAPLDEVTRCILQNLASPQRSAARA